MATDQKSSKPNLWQHLTAKRSTPSTSDQNPTSPTENPPADTPYNYDKFYASNIKPNPETPTPTTTNPNLNDTPSTTPSPTKTTPENPKPKKNTKTFSQRVGGFFRNLGIIVVLLVLILSGVLAFIIVNPEHPFSDFIVNRTPLQQVFSLNQNQTPGTDTNNESNSDNQEQPESRLGNDFFGLNPNPTPNTQPTVRIVEQVLPSVVSLSVRDTANRATINAGAAGSGFIADKDGLVVTNRHVVALACRDQDSSVSIVGQTQDQQAYELRLLGIDPIEDIALLQIQNPPSDLKPVSFANSNNLSLGEEVIAIGNVLGELQNTVTKGIISGLDRSLETNITDTCTGRSITADGLIQTDAAINRGNSGGPLFDAQGRLVGMNTFGTTDAQNVGLAIPSSTVTSVITSYRRNQEIIRPRLGVYSRPISQVLAEQLDWLPVDYGEILLAPNGIEAISEGSAAAQDGLREGDIILEINGQQIRSDQNNPSPLRRILLGLQAGTRVEMKILRGSRNPDGTYRYPQESSNLNITLGGVKYDLQTGNVINTNQNT